MNRKLIAITTLAAVLLALMLVAAVLMGKLQHRYQAARAIEEFRVRLTLMDAETLHTHRMLARWYNYCLGAKNPPADFEEAYGNILNVSGGMMGYISIRDGKYCLPIYHSASVSGETPAAGHVPGSALPLGGLGCHMVLTVPQEMTDLAEGDTFCLHVPGDVLYYCVREIREVSPGQTEGVLPVKGEDLCTLSVTVHRGTDARKILIHGIRTQEKRAAEPVPDRNLLYSVFWWVLGTLLLPLVTGMAGWTVRRVYRIWICKRLTNNMT